MKKLIPFILIAAMSQAWANDVKISKMLDGGARYCESKEDLSRADEVIYSIYSPKIARDEEIVNVNFLLSAMKCVEKEDGTFGFEQARVDEVSEISYNGVDTVLITRGDFKIRAYTDEGKLLFEKEIFSVKAVEEAVEIELNNDSISRKTVNNDGESYSAYVNINITYNEKRELGDYSNVEQVNSSSFRVLIK